MADNIAVTPGTGATVAADDIAGILFQRVKPAFGVDGSAVDVSASNPLPVTAAVSNFPATQPVSMASTPGLTDTQLRASAVPVSGPVTDTQLRASAVPVSLATAPALVASSATIGGVFRPGITYTDRSGTITSGGTAQTLAASNSSRKGYRVANLSAGDLWINDKGATAAASQPALKIPTGAVYESPAFGCSTAAISIFGATTSQAFEAAEA